MENKIYHSPAKPNSNLDLVHRIFFFLSMFFLNEKSTLTQHKERTKVEPQKKKDNKKRFQLFNNRK